MQAMAFYASQKIEIFFEYKCSQNGDSTIVLKSTSKLLAIELWLTLTSSPPRQFDFKATSFTKSKIRSKLEDNVSTQTTCLNHLIQICISSNFTKNHQMWYLFLAIVTSEKILGLVGNGSL